MDKSWAPGCNVVDIGSRSGTACSLIAAPERKHEIKKKKLCKWCLKLIPVVGSVCTEMSREIPTHRNTHPVFSGISSFGGFLSLNLPVTFL